MPKTPLLTALAALMALILISSLRKWADAGTFAVGRGGGKVGEVRLGWMVLAQLREVVCPTEIIIFLARA